MKIWDISVRLLPLGIVLLVIGWVFVRALKKSDDPAKLLMRWIITVLVLATGAWMLSGMGHSAGLFSIPFAIVIGLLWAPSWGAMLASPLTALFDGGDEDVEVKPLYAKAIGLRQKNQINAAVAAVREQLDKFPHDFTGLMLLAEIQAENLNDLPGAEVSIQKIVNQPSHHAPAQIAGALHALADWHLKHGQDPDSARLALEKIEALLPGSPFSQLAAQRISHLATVDQLLETHARPKLVLGHYEKNIGLGQQLSPNVKPPSEDSTTQAAHYVEHLQKHPQDTEAREKLSVIYAEHYQRLDMAADQLEQLITQPNQSAKQIARWLNLLADLQIKIGQDVSAAAQTLRRIPELLPNTSHVEQAAVRLEYLRMEAKRNEKSQTIKFGSYEKDLGLKKTTG